ncbi:MAG: hypothetical protein J1F63_05505 [Oscillospiraceae bacterium]|nr:hypothetical protein [Oscillospiraceae bacterium]
MKKYALLLLVLIFPYVFITYIAASIIQHPYADAIFMNNLLKMLILLTFLFTISLIAAAVTVLLCVIRKYEPSETMRINLVIKVVHTPAYIAFIAATVYCLSPQATSFSAILAGVLLSAALFTIMTNAITGVAGIIRAKAENKISIVGAVLGVIMQFVFFLDVLSATALYLKVKNNPHGR